MKYGIPSLVALLSSLVMTTGGCSGASDGRAAAGDPGLLGELHQAFAKVNPRIGPVLVLEIRPNPEVDPGREYAVLATAVAADANSPPDLGNELFGVFVADSSLTHVRRTLDVFPTRRWRDYHVRFGGEPGSGLEVIASGASYGDEPMRRVYQWSPSGKAPWLIRQYVAPGDTALIDSR